MPEFENPEGTHIGHQLARHCEVLGVSMVDLIAVAGEGSSPELGWITECRELSVDRIRRFHFLMTEAIARKAARPRLSVPFREQWFTTRNDGALHQGVLDKGRRTAWWWGAARTERGTGAYCYVCEQLIHAYDLGRGVTHPVRLAVMRHRAQHIRVLLGQVDTMRQRERT